MIGVDRQPLSRFFSWFPAKTWKIGAPMKFTGARSSNELPWFDSLQWRHNERDGVSKH